MGKYYQKPKASGYEYVEKTKKFCSVTTFRCMQLPKAWYEVLLKGIIDTAREIEKNVVVANAVYIDTKAPPAEQIRAYQERDKYLYQALRLLRFYDTQFEHLMEHIDIASSEKKRLMNIVRSIIKEEKKKNPEVSQIDITVTSRSDEFEYTSLNQTKCLKLKLTLQNKNAWLKAEAEAIDFINKRLSADKSIIRRLCA